ncbi:MAG TPA: hypothetical protein VFR78_09400 [Pyrinomonadaceae bacterium]|nr:hypothetical protein [Pyrinomonadaceae bacterium]
MDRKATLRIVLNLRALFVIGVLICLCVSSNVGLQFFPLPAGTTQQAANVQANKPLHAPHGDATSFRVPMMAQSQKRVDKEGPAANPLLALPIDRFRLPSETRLAFEIDYALCFLTSVTMAPRAGRAPPSLV